MIEIRLKLFRSNKHVNKETTYKWDCIKIFLLNTEMRTFLFFMLTSEDWTPILKTSTYLLNNVGSSFNTICLTETCCSNSEIINTSYFDISNYKAIPFERKTNKRGGSILLYVKKDLMYKIRNDLSISDKDKEILKVQSCKLKKHSLMIP